VQLSRDWKTPQRYTFEFERGRAEWTVNDANGLTVTLDGLPFVFDSRLQDVDGRAARTNPQSFITQLQHVAAAIRSDSAVLVDGEAGARAVRLIEACYAQKRLLAQPWLTPTEAASAARLATHSALPA
ncbi:MAG TPA: Gfo/Idh/MocA family oxidoreductase, partial [Candidatus Synoicihabitans sp.]|nr:Gfo/Idh/MocA family oxidoreductase [Candidatus Synoicihabitans sp.]